MQKELPHLHTTINITRGDEVEIVEGDLKGVVGTIREVKGNIAVIEPRKNLNIDVIE
jgi:ribosomal protein L24